MARMTRQQSNRRQNWMITHAKAARRDRLNLKVYGAILPYNCPGSMEDLEAAEIIFDRVMAGTCQNCGKKKGCTCVYNARDPDNPLRTVIGFQNA